MIDFFDNIPVTFYSIIYYITIMILCATVFFYYFLPNTEQHVKKYSAITNVAAVILCCLVILFIGFRPIHRVFTDMVLYAHSYNNIFFDYEQIDLKTEWFFTNLSYFCKEIGLIDREYFFVLSALYFGFMFAACWRLMRNNLFLAFLFCLASFSCFTYGVNGLRNGVACSILMFGMTFLKDKTWKFYAGLLLMFIAFSIHRSTILPSLSAILALTFVKSTKNAIAFWFISIFLSLLIGNYVTSFFSNLGFDDRMASYANLDENLEIINSGGYKVGFRFDFLIYSAIPLLMVWYITIKRNFEDEMYNIIAITYIISNSFWVMVIRSEQSNRFAYLSWFLYPLVIAYPLLRMNIWEDQDRKTAMILIAYAGFTFFMNFVYYA